MWHVGKNKEPGRGGFQDRDVGRSAIIVKFLFLIETMV